MIRLGDQLNEDEGQRQQSAVLLDRADLEGKSSCQGGEKAEVTPEAGKAQQTLALTAGVNI